MNLLHRIKIENIKGKDVFEVTFVDLTANQPNIVVAPNGVVVKQNCNTW